MGRKIRTQEEAKSVMHWLKEMTHSTNLEDVIVLGFHYSDPKEQGQIEEIRDIYLMHIQGHINPHVCLAYVDRSMDGEVLLTNMESLVKADLDSLYAAA